MKEEEEEDKELNEYENINDNNNKNDELNDDNIKESNRNINANMNINMNINNNNNTNNNNNNNNTNEEIKEFKYIYDGHVINNKKIKWEAKLEKATGWFSIGIGERKKIDDKNVKHDQEIILDKKETIKNKINFLLTNDHFTVIWQDGIMTYKKVKGSLPIREGDNLTFIYSPKFGQLKVQKSIHSFTIEDVIYKNNEWLTPVVVFSNKFDKVIFRNFHVLADYNK